MSTAYRIQRPDTAFALSTGKKRPREHRADHLAFLRRLPCTVCGKYGVEAAHVRYADPAYGKRETGISEKPDDRWCTPLCPTHHREQHTENEREWWAAKGIDPLRIASMLFSCSGDETAAELVLAAARGASR